MSTRDVRYQLGIKWGASYTDESDYLMSATGNYAINAPGTPTIGGSGIVSQCTLILNNVSRRFSPNTPASITNYGGYYHTPMYLNVSIDGGSNYYRIFSGVIAAITETAPTPTEPGTVSVDCRDYSDKYLNHRASTAMSDLVAMYGTSTELDIIEQFLDDAGLSDSSYGWKEATPEASEQGMFIIPVAWMDDESPIEECWSLAAACGGWFYNDVWNEAQPYFRYRNATHWSLQSISTSAPDNELRRSNGDYQGLQVSYDHTELFKEVTVEWSSRKVGSSDVVWEPDETIIVPANGTKTVTATFRTPVYALDTLTYSAATSGGLDISADVSDDLATATAYAQRVELTFTNTHATYAAVLKNVQLTGQPIEGGPEGESTAISTNTSFWDGRTSRKRAIRSSVWVQTETHATVLANMLMDVHETPAAFYRLQGVKGDPQRKLGQKVRLYDSAAFDTANEPGYITAMDFSLSISGFYQNLTIIDGGVMYVYTESSPSYFIIGTNRISINSGDAGTNRGRLFY